MPALINVGGNEPKIIIFLMHLHIIQETQTPTKRAILPEKSENCLKSFTNLYGTFKKTSYHFLPKPFLYFAQILSTFCTNRFHILQKFFQVFSDAFVGDVWPEERQITNDGQPGRGWQKVSPISLKKYFEIF